MQINVTEVVISIVGLVFTAVVIPLTKAAFAWLRERTHSEALRSAIGEAEAVADNVVASLQASVVEGLKSKSADGKLSADDIKMISVKAFDMFISDLSAKSLAVIAGNADDIGAYVKNLIEARLLVAKKQGGTNG
ncbi:MAG: hypothetical protein ACM3S4_04665 [Burkholderiales bacterium]